MSSLYYKSKKKEQIKFAPFLVYQNRILIEFDFSLCYLQSQQLLLMLHKV